MDTTTDIPSAVLEMTKQSSVLAKQTGLAEALHVHIFSANSRRQHSERLESLDIVADVPSGYPCSREEAGNSEQVVPRDITTDIPSAVLMMTSSKRGYI